MKNIKFTIKNYILFQKKVDYHWLLLKLKNINKFKSLYLEK